MTGETSSRLAKRYSMFISNGMIPVGSELMRSLYETTISHVLFCRDRLEYFSACDTDVVEVHSDVESSS
jgi:hypothetical protein